MKKLTAVIFAVLVSTTLIAAPASPDAYCDGVRATCKALEQATYDNCRQQGGRWLACVVQADQVYSECMGNSGCGF